MHDFRKIKEKRAGKLSFSTLCMMFFSLPGKCRYFSALERFIKSLQRDDTPEFTN
jgi:hypothetical protein